MLEFICKCLVCSVLSVICRANGFSFLNLDLARETRFPSEAGFSFLVYPRFLHRKTISTVLVVGSTWPVVHDAFGSGTL